MAKRDKRYKEDAKIAKWRRSGNGEKTLLDYVPWRTVRNSLANGLQTRGKGWKTQRVHQILSPLEDTYFLALEWSPSVVDIREHYPLIKGTDTIEIATQLGIRHPTDSKTKLNTVMTTDFLVTTFGDNKHKHQARALVSSRNLSDRRTIQKLEIERLYWEQHGIDWGIVTEHEIPEILVENVKWVHNYRDSTKLSLKPDGLNLIAELLTQLAAKGDCELSKIGAQVDDLTRFEVGTSLSVARHLIATRYWQVDMYTPIDPAKPLLLLNY